MQYAKNKKIVFISTEQGFQKQISCKMGFINYKLGFQPERRDFMINWIIGGIIVLVTILIVVRFAIKVKKGQSGCGCGCPGCDKQKCCM